MSKPEKDLLSAPITWQSSEAGSADVHADPAAAQSVTYTRAMSLKTRRAICAGAVALADLVAFGAAYLHLSFIANPAMLGIAPVMIALTVVALHWMIGFYPGDRLQPQEILRRHALAFLAAALLVAAIGGFDQGGWPGVAMSEVFLMIAMILQVPARYLVQHFLHHIGLWGTPTRFIADAEKTRALETFFTLNWRFGLLPTQDTGAIVALDYVPTREGAIDLHRRYDKVLVLADLPQQRVSGIGPRALRGAVGEWIADPSFVPISPRKRAFDLAISVPALIVAAPVLALASAAIWLVDPGPVFYRQTRDGHNGRVLRMLKLRTMYRDADARLQALLRDDPAARAEWETHFKLQNDPRILPVIGKFLRGSSCDELPQLLHVIAGEMSIVGPRPFPEYHLAAMPADFRAKRGAVAPGITGLWQITARSDADLAMQQQLDEHYIDNRSVWLDLWIVLGTFAALLGRKGAY
ncbi:sugar transferase [Thioclava sp.]|uniref:sugar transferase n=1 Tax=Thioclava sp. TaxID=1933450 RepID=UPI003AA83AE7